MRIFAKSNRPTVREADLGPDCEDQMVTVFEDGNLLVDYSFDQVRKRAEMLPGNSKKI